MSASSIDVAIGYTKPSVAHAALRRGSVEDRGPWAFVAASVSFALVLACVMYISASSF
jgi:hypothetical protein